MADDTPLSVYDLYGKKPRQAAVLQAARAAELQRQREVGLIGMRSDAPEARAAGQAQMGSADQEQRALEEMGPRVLAQTLAERAQTQREKYEAESLAIQRGQLGLAREALKTGNILKQQEQVRATWAPVLDDMMKEGAKDSTVKAWADFFHLSGSKLEEMLRMGTKARLEHLNELGKMLGPAPPALGGPVVPQGGGEAPHAAPPAPAPAVAPMGDVEMLMRKKYPPKTLTRK